MEKSLYLRILVKVGSYCPDGIYLFKVNNRDTRAISGIFSKVTINLPERRHWLRSSVFIVNFEQVNTGWVKSGCLKGVNVVYTFFTHNLKIETFNLLIDTCIHVMLYAYLIQKQSFRTVLDFFYKIHRIMMDSLFSCCWLQLRSYYLLFYYFFTQTIEGFPLKI